MIWLHLATICLYFIRGDGGVPRPRGVPASKAGFYDPKRDFPCFDGSAIIPFERINDDYCDCMDGSDEPGTPACPNGTFHCTNAGHLEKFLPSSRVNDGICDCCDGTDEYSGRVTCANYCRELGRQHREEEEKMRTLEMEGHELYKEYVLKGQEAMREKQVKLDALRLEKDNMEDRRNQLEAEKIAAEEPEKAAKDKHMLEWKAEKDKRDEAENQGKIASAFDDLDNNDDKVVSYQELQAHSEFDIDSNGDVSDEEAMEYLEENTEVDFEAFQTKIWPHIKDIYKKSVGAQTEEPPKKENVEGEDDDEEEPDPEDYDVDEDEDEEEDNEDFNEEDVKDMPDYDDDTKKLIEIADAAREAFKQVNDMYKELEEEIQAIEGLLNNDLGENKEFYLLKGECYELTDREYTYKLCPYDKCTQRDKRGGMETNLGKWGKFDESASNKYDVMKFESGQNCWNGPDRSVKVKMQCGIHNELLSASEPNKCEYEFAFSTPSVCRNPPAAVQIDPRDEL